MTTLQTTPPIETKSPIEILFERDPLSLSEEELGEITANLVQLCREDIRIWSSEREAASKAGKKPSGTRTKKAQITAQQKLLASKLGEDFDPFA